MIKITFPDGAQREYPKGTSALDVAKSISEGLARRILAAKVDDEVRDLLRPINEDATLKFLAWDDKEGKSTFWHSSAHLFAEALESIYPGAKFGIGPAIDNGFYYDVDLGGTTLTNEDLIVLEKKMSEFANSNSSFNRTEISKADALKYFNEKGDEYKLELINNLKDGEITFYQQGNFTDLCRGPHLPNTSFIKAIKLTNIAGAYWRGDSNNKQMTRVYGITFPKQKELDEYMVMVEEARKRDHRKIGKEMEIFTFDDDIGQGLPLWLPNGGAMIEELEKLAKSTEFRAGYSRVKSPHIAKENLYLTSGHLPYYAESMFPPMEVDGTKYYLKAMNCPHHHKIFSSSPKSYKDLPIRLAEYGTCYRYEQSGELFGLMRVRSMNMNDAHIYCTEEQFESEFKAVNEMYQKYFKIFGVDKYIMRFSTHDPAKLGKKYLDMPELWKKTEEMVRRVLISSNIPYIEVSDEAAFYGPKIDVQIFSAIGREFTLATNQVDFGQPARFNLTFQNKHNQPETPICIHRAPLGTHERFIGFLIEHYAGKFPMWLSPLQVTVLPVGEKFIPYAEIVKEKLKNADIRTVVDERNEKIGKKIRDAELKRVPCMLVVGEKEEANHQISFRKQGAGDQGIMNIDDFIRYAKEEIENYR